MLQRQYDDLMPLYFLSCGISALLDVRQSIVGPGPSALTDDGTHTRVCPRFVDMRLSQLPVSLA